MKITKLFSLFILTSIICTNTKSQINHIEPLNWFVDMKNPNLQLLVNGNNIGETTPQIKYPGVTIKNVSKADSKNYLFIDLIIANNTKPGIINIYFNQDGKEIYSYPYELKKEHKHQNYLKALMHRMPFT